MSAVEPPICRVVIPQPSPARQEPVGQARPTVLERLRVAVPATPLAEELVEAVRLELKREYERGYLEAKRRPAAKESDLQRFNRRMQRRARHGWREWLASSRQLRKTLTNMVLVVVVCAVGIVVALQVTNSGVKKLAVPGQTR
jgi:hypothetical protein